MSESLKREAVTSTPSVTKIEISTPDGPIVAPNFKNTEISSNLQAQSGSATMVRFDLDFILSSFKENEDLKKLLNEIAINSLNVRNFLGYQLDHALENISEEFFQSKKQEYFSKMNKLSDTELEDLLALFLASTNDEFSSDDLSGLFNTSSSRIENVLNSLYSKIKK